MQGREKKIQIKKKEQTQEPGLQRADIFWARPKHLGPTPLKETRKSAVYELSCTCTQERHDNRRKEKQMQMIFAVKKTGK